jgi:ABC-type bacteriocin/lantibiotic exporter with double-glycine peptidase domain
MTTEPNKNITPLQRLWLLLKPDSKEITNIYLYSAFNGLVALSLPLGIQAIINLIQGGLVNTAWIVLVTVVVLGVGLNGLIKIFQFRITENIQQKIFTRGALEFAYRIPRIKMEELYKHYAPELMNRYFDIMSIQKGLSKLLIDFSAAILQVVFGLLLLSLYHPFFIIFSIILVFLILIIIRFTAKKGLDTSLLESKYKYQLAHWLEELARTVSSFKLSGNSTLPMKKTDEQISSYLNAKEKHFKILVQQYSLLVVFKMIIAAGLLILGGILVMEQVINIGQFVAAEIIILLVIDSVEKLISSLENIYDVITSVEKIGQVTDIALDAEEGLNLGEHCKNQALSVEMSNVIFSYPNQPNPTLRGINLIINPGDRILIEGKNGSGKTTLMQIIASLYDIQNGQIVYQGLPKANLNMTSIRAAIGNCMNQGLLFNGTVLENITMGRSNASFEDARWAVENLKLTEFIKSLPKGYDTIIDPQGKKLSMSITEKLLLARSIVDKPKMLLIEDAFEHIDDKDRKQIIDFLLQEAHNWTIVATSNDPYFAQKANRVLFLEDGVIAREGTQSERFTSL